MTGGRTRTSGFTLLELLMVVIIIAILASIALPQYLKTAERTRASEALSILAAIRSSELRYKALDPAGAYTTVETRLDIDIPGYGATPASALWTYSVCCTAGVNGANARAARITTGKVIDLDITTGNNCTNDTNAYALVSTPC